MSDTNRLKLEERIDGLEKKLALLQEFADKNLHVASIHLEAYQQRSGRPYYCLDDGWGLTSLDTGQPFFVNTRDRNLSPWIIMGGTWEPNVGRSLLAYVRPGMNVCDIGAHIGYYAVKMGSLVGPSGRAYAFEPNPEVARVCLENLKINGLGGHTSLHAFALGDSRGVAKLTYSKSNMTSANLLGDQEADYSTLVEVRPLDDVIPLDVKLDLVKLDAEGFEKPVLAGAQKVLERSPDCALMIELGLHRWERLGSLEELPVLCGASKALYAVEPDGRLRRMELPAIREFLLGCAYQENYFLIAPEERARSLVGHLIV